MPVSTLTPFFCRYRPHDGGLRQQGMLRQIRHRYIDRAEPRALGRQRVFAQRLGHRPPDKFGAIEARIGLQREGAVERAPHGGFGIGQIGGAGRAGEIDLVEAKLADIGKVGRQGHAHHLACLPGRAGIGMDHREAAIGIGHRDAHMAPPFIALRPDDRNLGARAGARPLEQEVTGLDRGQGRGEKLSGGGACDQQAGQRRGYLAKQLESTALPGREIES
nr:hypothetical protein [Hyphomonas sp.]